MAKRRTKHARRRRRKTQKGGNMLNYLLPFAFMKASNMLARKTRKRKSRKAK